MKFPKFGIVALATVFCGLLPSLGAASDVYVTCVQKQLAALGYSGVSASGRPDGATRAAAIAFQKQHANRAGVALIPPLSAKTAVSWCREIGAVSPKLRQYMPGSSAPYVMTDGGPGSRATNMVSRASRETEQFFRSRYGIYPASRVDVAGADSGEELAWLATQLQKLRGASFGRMSSTVSRVCKTPSTGYGGQAYRDQLLLCWRAVGRNDAAWEKKVYLTVSSIMVHEYMHHVQRELSNEKHSPNRSSSGRSKRGPAWMVEGTAEIIEYRWRIAKTGKRLSITALQKEARSSQKSLRAMHGHGTVKDARQYQIALFAAYLLEERFGVEAVFNYWRYIGQGRSWDRAFEAAFGMKMSTYQDLFQTLRVDPAKAAAFANGK